MKLFRQGSYATVTSTAALVIALGGTSYAAAMITGDDIKNGTVTTADVKNHTLKVKDFSAGTKSQLTGASGARGPAGAPGPTGATGPAGAQGPAGLSNVASVYNDDPTVMTGSFKTVLSLQLQPGSYMITGKALVGRTATNARAQCNVESPGATDIAIASIPDNGVFQTLMGNVVVTTTSPGTARLDCTGANSRVLWKKLTAVKVGSVTNNAGPNVARITTGKRP